MIALLDKYSGGPVGLGTLAASLSEEKTPSKKCTALPYAIGMIDPHSSRPRRHPRAYQYFGRELPPPTPPLLAFEPESKRRTAPKNCFSLHPAVTVRTREPKHEFVSPSSSRDFSFTFLQRHSLVQLHSRRRKRKRKKTSLPQTGTPK